MQATVELLDLKPSAIEHVDRPLLDQTKGQLLFQSARDLLELDTKPCESFLIVEFYEDVADRLAILQAKQLGLRTKILTSTAEMNLVWSVRKAGLSLLTGCVGPAKPVAFIEDAAIPPKHLPEYVAGLRAIMAPLGLDASLLRTRRERSAPCSSGSRSARRKRSEEIPAGRRSNFRTR